MKIALVADRRSDRGGADHYLRDVAAVLRGAGHTLRWVVGQDDGGPPPGAPADEGCAVVRGLGSAVARDARLQGLRPALAGAELAILQNVMNPIAIARVCATLPTIAVVQDHRSACPGPGRTLPDGAACQGPMAAAPCAGCLPDEAYRAATRALTAARASALAGARQTVVLSRWMARMLDAEGAAAPRVCPPAAPLLPARSTPGRAFLLGGRLVAHKAPAFAHAAWTAAGRPLPLRVAGEGPTPLDGPGVEPLGWLDRPALHRVLGDTRALLFPARWQEPFGILGIEALAAGAPVILTATGGMAEWAGPGTLAVPPGDERAFAAAIGALAADPAQARRLGDAGQAWARDTFPAAGFAAAWAGLVDETLSRP